MRKNTLILQIRILIVLFIIALTASGLTAIPLTTEAKLLNGFLNTIGAPIINNFPSIRNWIERVSTGIIETNRQYPFMAYGTDWLAFGHIVIAISFIGPLINPKKNVWVIEYGMIACVLVIPWALLFGPLRGIPFIWQLVDCSFGIIGIIPLAYVRRLILKLEAQEEEA